MVEHADTTDIHLGAHVEEVDPGTVGPKKLWVDRSVGPPFQMYVRNEDDTGWQVVGAVTGGGAGGGSLTNQALVSAGASATASASMTIAGGGSGDQPASLAIDNDIATEWDTPLGTDAPTEWLRVDLGAAKDISSVRVVQAANSTWRATQFKLQSSTDDATWDDQMTFGSVVDTDIQPLPTVVTAQYWRLLGVTGPPSGPWGIRTFELFSGSTAGLEGFTNPMTTAGDLITGGTGGTATRLAKGTDGQGLRVDPSSHLLGWYTPTDVGFANPMTTIDDIIIGGATGTAARLAKGADGQVLTVDPTTHHLVWADPAAGGTGGHEIQDEGTPLTARSALNFEGPTVAVTDDAGGDASVVTIGGFDNPMTTSGDIIVGGSAGVATRMAKGADDEVLTINPTTHLPDWMAPAGGGGGGSAHVIQDEGTPLTDRAALNFVGAGVSVTDDAGNNASVVTIPGGGSGGPSIYTPFTTPPSSGWSWHNQGTATVTTDSDGVILLRKPTPGASDTVAAYLRAPGISAPWYASAFVVPNHPAVNFPHSGMAIKLSTDAKMMVLGLSQNPEQIGVIHYTSATAYSSAPASMTLSQGPIWLRIGNDSTNLKFWFSRDGRLWFLVYSVALPGFLNSAPDQVGIEVDPVSVNSGMSLHSWAVAATFSGVEV